MEFYVMDERDGTQQRSTRPCLVRGRCTMTEFIAPTSKKGCCAFLAAAKYECDWVADFTCRLMDAVEWPSNLTATQHTEVT